MPCPYFCPAEKFDERPWAKRLPLGDAYSGSCQADTGASSTPAEDVLKEFCHFGYARNRCPRFPQDAGPDATRFAIARHDDDQIEIYWVMEKDHHPFAHGPLAYSIQSKCFSGAGDMMPCELTQRQAQAYVESYLRRRSTRRDD